MGLVIFSVILTLILIIALGISVDLKKEELHYKIRPRMLFGLLGLSIILLGCYTMVPANSVGIRYNPFSGGTQSSTLGEGFYGKNPLEKIYVLSTRVEEFKFGNISIQTKDSQYVNSELQVQARIDGTKASEYFKKHGNKTLGEIQTIIANTLQKEFEKVTTTYNIMEVLGEKRDEIVNKTLESVKVELLKDGVLVERIILVDTDAGKDVEQAIRNEAIAKKNAEAAIYKKQQAQTEGEAKVIEAQKTKEANELLNKTLTDEQLMRQFIEKWDGKLPTTYAGDDVLSIFNLK